MAGVEVGRNTGPKISRNPLELLQGYTEEPYINKIWGPVIGGGLLFIAVCVGNWAVKRPVMSGIQRHVIATAAGAGIGKVIDDTRRDYFAERDAVLRHYIQLHPEEFPELEGKKFADVLEPWVPIR